MYRLFFFLIFLTFSQFSFSQNISGTIFDENKNPIPAVNISTENNKITMISENNGSYSIDINSNKSIVIFYSCIGYEREKIRIPMLSKNEKYVLNITLKTKNNLLDDVEVKDSKNKMESFQRIKTKHVKVLPSTGNNIEALLKTLPGVSSANELSSQYSVRGGNFDENLVYVNGLEIYRPFLIHAGQQEGLSFINSDLIQNISFSSGGFEAKYGDKISSVLDITYKEPKKNKGSIKVSLLGASGHYEGISKNRKLSTLIGIRYKTNKYLLNSLETTADYNPISSDIQTFINYKINNTWKISFLGSINNNKYHMIPKNRETEFGTINDALKLKIFFEGQEIDKYSTNFGAITATYNPNNKLQLQFSSSAFQTNENENYDILGEYFLYQLDNNLGSDDFGDIAFDRGVGKYLNHARNNLKARVLNLSHKGIQVIENNQLEWGIKIQKENIQDKISEWKQLDSAFYNLPHPLDNIGGVPNPNQEIILNELKKTEILLSSYRNMGYLQWTKNINNLTINTGTRGSYWTYNEEFLLSPRISISYAPFWKSDVVFRSSTGIYYQSPFYKELRTVEGIILNNIQSQKSIHYILASDYLFYKWGRPFKLTTEFYYKQLNNIIPYKVENVFIQYLPDQIANGYATGIDIKINGEFVKNTESWMSFSLMKTEENIKEDYYEDNTEVDYIPRPTDQRFKLNIFFQDYIPQKENYKMHLNLVYGSGFPFGPPKGERYQDILRIPSYRRVDIGFSVNLKSKQLSKAKWLNIFDKIWFSAEVFNLLDINNTVSYIWISDITGRQYAVPNYMTSRQLNGKLILNF